MSAEDKTAATDEDAASSSQPLGVAPSTSVDAATHGSTPTTTGSNTTAAAATTTKATTTNTHSTTTTPHSAPTGSAVPPTTTTTITTITTTDTHTNTATGCNSAAERPASSALSSPTQTSRGAAAAAAATGSTTTAATITSSISTTDSSASPTASGSGSPPPSSSSTQASAQPSTSAGSASGRGASDWEMKRSAVKQLIERYFYQLQSGCGNPHCKNVNCASSGQVPEMTANQIAGKAIQLFSRDAKLCDIYSQPPKVPRTHADSPSTSASLTSSSSSSTSGTRATTNTPPAHGEPDPEPVIIDLVTPPRRSPSTTASSSVGSAMRRGPPQLEVEFLDEAVVDALINTPRNGTELLVRAINRVYSSVERLSRSFKRSAKQPAHVIATVDLVGDGDDDGDKEAAGDAVASCSAAASSSKDLLQHKAPWDLKKEDLRQLEGECDKDEDSQEVAEATEAAAAAAAAESAADVPAARPLHDTDDPMNGSDSDLLSLEGVEVNCRAPARLNLPSSWLSRSLAHRQRGHRNRLHRGRGAGAAAGGANDDDDDDDDDDEDDEDDYDDDDEDDDDDDDDEDDDDDDDDEDEDVVVDVEDFDEQRLGAEHGELVDLVEYPEVHRIAFLRRQSHDDGSGIDCSHGSCDVDFEALRNVRAKMYALQNPAIARALNRNIIVLAESIRNRQKFYDWEAVVHCLVIGFDMATKTSNRYADMEFLERSLPKLCQAAGVMPTRAQARLARIWAENCQDQLQSLVQCCQQLITLQVIVEDSVVQDNEDVIAITMVLMIAFYANILAGVLEKRPPSLAAGNADAAAVIVVDDEPSGSKSPKVAARPPDDDFDDDDIFMYSQMKRPHYPKFAENRLEKELGVSIQDCRVPLVPFEEFYNEPLSDAIQMDRDYLSYKNLAVTRGEGKAGKEGYFSFMLYSFILTPATKVVALYYDSRIRMYSNASMLFNYFGDGSSPLRTDLKMKVRRDNIIHDALIALELVAMSNPKDLKKQLVVEFDGEQGIDEGGVSKEFFQLIVEEIFNPDFGMFIQQAETNTMWFNPTPFENEAQFTLIGIIIGLAIYNNVILAVNFPMVVYRKLMGCEGSFFDLQDFDPLLHRSLQTMLDYADDDFEEVFTQTFRISYTNVFGDMVEHDLKENGAECPVTRENCREFVDLYADYLLNVSIHRQFKAFKKGFEMVTDESPLKLLFRPEEIELLVCGSRKFDFVELEKSTEYEGGFSATSPVIRYFWEIVHSMPEDLKRKLLEFTTGSDRVPVGGFSRLKMMITRHGPDSDRLPTSHTCFNVLLLPEYSSKEKLEDRLLKAISYSKGFGML